MNNIENDILNHAIIQWGRTYLLSHGYTLKSNLPENVKNTPWSYVIRYITTDGYIYLKHTPELLAFESAITKILHDQFHAFVPIIIAQNAELNCFLMKDAGKPLREILKQKFNTTLVCKAIDQFTLMQLTVADHVNIFLNIGVPDWRLDKLPDAYMQMLLQKDLLIADGLLEKEIRELEALLPMVSNLCKKLSDYSIKPSIVQPDFHDNNILITESSQNITFIDLGEIAISHPFFSLIGCLQQVKKHHGLTEEDDRYRQIMKACLKNFINFEPEKRLLDAFEIAHALHFFYGALCGYRLMAACDKARLMEFQPGKFSASLKEFITHGITLN